MYVTYVICSGMGLDASFDGDSNKTLIKKLFRPAHSVAQTLSNTLNTAKHFDQPTVVADKNANGKIP
jgi:hypothetical protein